MTPRTVLLKQAVFGEVKGAHTVRQSTFQTQNLASLAMRLDLPDQAPVGVTWAPYISGFPFDEYYVIAHIRADTQATRSGMILCRAGIVSTAEIGDVCDLRQILDILKADLPTTPLDDMRLPIGVPAHEPPTSLTRGLANVLATRSSEPAVLEQGDAAELALFQLWQQLPAGVRASFSFRLSFTPKDIVETTKPTVVFVPYSLRPRWPIERIVGEASSYVSPLAEVLAGDTRLDGFQSRADKLGVRLCAVSDLIKLQSADDHLSKNTFQGALAAFRIIQTMQEAVGTSGEGRGDIVAHLASSLRGEVLASAMLLRNVSGVGFPPLAPLWSALKTLVASAKFEREEDLTTFSLLADTSQTSLSVQSWKEAVTSGLKVAVVKHPNQFAEALWRYAGPPEGLDAVAGIDSGGLVGASLIAAAPNAVLAVTAKALKWLGKQERSLDLIAVVLRAEYSPVQALKEYASFDPKLGTASALDLLFANGSVKELVAAASNRADDAVVQAIGRAMAKDPSRFRTADFGEGIVRRIWGVALTLSQNAWSAPADLGKALAGALSSSSTKGTVDEQLFEAIANSRYADVFAFEDRAELWASIPARFRQRFLKQTAAGWLDEASKGNIPLQPEPPLRAAILAHDSLEKVLRNLAQRGMGHAFTQVVVALDSLSSALLRSAIDSLKSTDRRWSSADATELGKYIAARGWSDIAMSAKAAFERGRIDLRPALEACQALLPRWVRYSLGLGRPTDEEAWEMLRDLSISLYPYGPDERHLWKRSGGDNSKLSKGRGESTWFDAIDMMRKGHAVKPEKLLQEMRKDFSSNAQVGYLADLASFRPKGGGGFFSLFMPFGLDK